MSFLSLMFEEELEVSWFGLSFPLLFCSWFCVCTAINRLWFFFNVFPDGVARVPQAVLEKSHADLDRLRMSVFQQLQPKLHCKLGESSEHQGLRS